jgi:tetratricopeptide (TPR) repeat protein
MADEIDMNLTETHLEGLDVQFMDGLKRMAAKDIDGAAECFRRVLQREPRLAEPRLELARILMQTGQLREAEAEAREAIKILESGGQWIDILEEHQVSSVAYGLLGEVLRMLAESDEVVFADPEAWRNIVDEAHAAFRRARTLDPDNAHAGYWASGFDVGAGAGNANGDDA